ncbi:carbon-nitrogen hydrolase [Zopfia rhizophila CBS 207.26]|uniref:Carbon-nitrogen hydrolase n=1 Tax=Zopfia rhizophila CBS 207.26 TaxID=1314779 RepID=A0A6A6EVL0_9PEZI|nr:carbon-nitrogen hydrolase [Zopfia rhizophila CBS 207.26]
MILTIFIAAATTSEPAWFDLEGRVQKTMSFINDAGQAGCRLVAFPKVFNYQQSLPMLKKYHGNSLPVDSEEMRCIRRAARDNQLYSICSNLLQVLISPTGDVINHRRKIKPTQVKKLVYGDGAGDTSCQLNCWKNMNPSLKSLNVSMGEQMLKYPDPATNVADPASNLVTPAYAIRAGTWTLAPFQRLSVEGLKKNTLEGVEPERDPLTYNGHARIFRPDGSLVVEPAKNFYGPLLIGLNECHLTKTLANFGGHQMRPDFIRLFVDTRHEELVTEVDLDGGIATYSTRERLRLNTLPERSKEKKGQTDTRRWKPRIGSRSI